MNLQARRILMTADAVGGVWSYALDMIEGLRADQTEFFLAVMGPAPSSAQCEALTNIPNLTWEHRPYALEWMDEPWEGVDAAGKWLMELETSFAPDVVHLNGYAHAALPWSTPVVVVAHSCVCTWWRAVKGERAPERFESYRQRVQAGLASADLTVAPSRSMMKALVGEYGPLGKRKAIYNGRSEMQFASGLKSHFIFSAGRLWDEAKNLALLDRIATDVSWPIYVAGDGPPDLLSNLHKLDHLPSLRMKAVLAEAAIYAAPAWYEPFGLAVLEAALSECVLVLADIPTFRELWDGAAVFVSPGDPQAWSKTLNHLATDDSERRGWSKRARHRAAQFSRDRMLEGYRKAYASLASQVTPQAIEVAA